MIYGYQRKAVKLLSIVMLTSMLHGCGGGDDPGAAGAPPPGYVNGVYTGTCNNQAAPVTDLNTTLAYGQGCYGNIVVQNGGISFQGGYIPAGSYGWADFYNRSNGGNLTNCSGSFSVGNQGQISCQNISYLLSFNGYQSGNYVGNNYNQSQYQNYYQYYNQGYYYQQYYGTPYYTTFVPSQYNSGFNVNFQYYLGSGCSYGCH